MVSEARRAWKKKYDLEHAEKNKEYRKKYREEHREEILAKKKAYRDAHKAEISKSDKSYRETEIGHANNLTCKYRQSDAAMGLPTTDTITTEWLVENVFKQQCIYCGESNWRLLGADRINNTKGHTPENCVPCCGKCNVEKGRKHSPIEFQAMKFQEILGYQ